MVGIGSRYTGAMKWVVQALSLLLLLLVSAVCALAIAQGMWLVPLYLIAGLAGVLLAYTCISKPKAGFFLVMFLAFFTVLPGRVLKTQLPVTTGIEILVLLLLLGSTIKKLKNKNRLYRSPASLGIFLYALLIIIELFNPHMHSVAGWLFYCRRLFMFIALYVVAYRVFDDLTGIKQFFKGWFALALLACIYGCAQQWFGMLPFEMDYLRSNPHEFKLYFQGGTIRKFSFLSDPTTFGIMAGCCAAFMLVLLINQKTSAKRFRYVLVFILLVLGMSYSGTRTANIMLPASVALYTLLTITSKRTLAAVVLFLLAGAFVLFGPVQNGTINRIRSTFDSKEESGTVRDENRKYIQPYIYSHPLGGGVATSGVLGEKYNPKHPLAGFPPDSGFLLAAIELGWVGFAVTILVYFLMLYQCVHYYFLTQKEEHRVLIAGVTVALFSLIITQYSQVTIGQLPTALFFYAGLAIVTRLKELGATETAYMPLTTFKPKHIFVH